MQSGGDPKVWWTRSEFNLLQQAADHLREKFAQNGELTQADVRAELKGAPDDYAASLAKAISGGRVDLNANAESGSYGYIDDDEYVLLNEKSDYYKPILENWRQRLPLFDRLKSLSGKTTRKCVQDEQCKRTEAVVEYAFERYLEDLSSIGDWAETDETPLPQLADLQQLSDNLTDAQFFDFAALVVSMFYKRGEFQAAADAFYKTFKQGVVPRFCSEKISEGGTFSVEFTGWLDRMLLEHPEEPKYLALQGIGHIRNKEFRQAIASFEKAISIDPSRAGLYGFCAVAYEKVQDYKSAETMFLKILSLNENNAGAVWNNVGVVREKHGDFNGAIAAFEKALEFDHSASSAAYGLIKNSEEQGRIDGALQYAENAIRTYSGYEVAMSYCFEYVRLLEKRGTRRDLITAKVALEEKMLPGLSDKFYKDERMEALTALIRILGKLGGSDNNRKADDYTAELARLNME